MPILGRGGPRLTWLWALLILLSALKASSTLLLPPDSPLHPFLCRWMPGLPACHSFSRALPLTERRQHLALIRLVLLKRSGETAQGQRGMCDLLARGDARSIHNNFNDLPFDQGIATADLDHEQVAN